jgi:hypothetical protein
MSDFNVNQKVVIADSPKVPELARNQEGKIYAQLDQGVYQVKIILPEGEIYPRIHKSYLKYA